MAFIVFIGAFRRLEKSSETLQPPKLNAALIEIPVNFMQLVQRVEETFFSQISSSIKLQSSFHLFKSFSLTISIDALTIII